MVISDNFWNWKGDTPSQNLALDLFWKFLVLTEEFDAVDLSDFVLQMRKLHLDVGFEIF